MSGLRVLANLCSVVPGQVGGSEVYAARLLAAVASMPGLRDGAVELELASMAGVRSAHPELARLALHEARWRGNSRVRRAAVESTWLARRSVGFDLVHHFGGRLPARRAGLPVLTVHDIQPLDLPSNFSATKRCYLGWALPRSVRAAALVTVPSQWVADRLADRLAVPPDRIRVVPSTYRAWTAPTGPAPLDGQPFVLYPAATSPTRTMPRSSRPTPRRGLVTATPCWCSPGPRAAPTPRWPSRRLARPASCIWDGWTMPAWPR